MSHDTITRPRVEPEQKLQPPARWRNWYRTKMPCKISCERCGAAVKYRKAGEVIDVCEHTDTFPSREVAEIAGQRIKTHIVGWLCATKVGERP